MVSPIAHSTSKAFVVQFKKKRGQGKMASTFTQEYLVIWYPVWISRGIMAGCTDRVIYQDDNR